jgi:D-alanyl-D-alanine carboxypeptidase (penicillin-binding protein 5/6)
VVTTGAHVRREEPSAIGLGTSITPRRRATFRQALLLVAAVLLLVPSAHAAGPSVDARAFLVEDGRTGEVLLAGNPAEQVPIASLTKLMTVLLTLERTQLSDIVTVSPEAAEVGESSIHLRAGEQLTVRDLVEACLIQSANDAAWALADHVGRGSESRFVALMNRRARELGLSDTHFVRPDGLDAAGHVSSARDVTTLARLLMRKPVVRQIVAMRDATIAGGRRLHTWNDLLGSYPGVVGVKTGHTTAAGWSEVAAVRGSGVTVYATVLGSPDRSTRNGDLVELMTWGLSRFRVVPVISAGRSYARAETSYGRGGLSLVAPRSLRRAVLVGRPLVERVVAPVGVELPVSKGQKLGEIRVYERQRLIARSPLVASRSISKPGTIGRAGWYVGRTAHNMWGWIP